MKADNNSKKRTLKSDAANIKRGVVNPNSGVTVLNANLPLLRGSNYAQVVAKKDNSPLKGAEVTLINSSGNKVSLPDINNAAQDNPYTSDQAGKYLFKDVKPGAYYLKAVKEGYYDYQPELIEITSKADINDLIKMEKINKDDLTINKETEAKYSRPGQEVEYTITVINNKAAAISHLKIKDTLPDELIYIKNSANLGGSHSSGKISWELNDLKPGQTELKYKVKIAEDAELGNQAVNNVEADLNGVIFKDSHELQISPPEIIINKTAADDQVSTGEFISYKVEIQNESEFDLDSFTLYDKIPAGFKYVQNSAVLVSKKDNEKKLKPKGNRLLSFKELSIPADQSLEIRYSLVVGTGVVTGKSYVNQAYAKFEEKLISNTAKESVLVTADPLFTTSTIIGKVYLDNNNDGVQSEAEEGLAGVKIISTTGQVIKTDQFGRFHFSVKGGDNIQAAQTLFLKLKTDTLPAGTEIITENPVIIKISEGLISEVNFRIKNIK